MTENIYEHFIVTYSGPFVRVDKGFFGYGGVSPVSDLERLCKNLDGKGGIVEFTEVYSNDPHSRVGEIINTEEGELSRKVSVGEFVDYLTKVNKRFKVIIASNTGHEAEFDVTHNGIGYHVVIDKSSEGGYILVCESGEPGMYEDGFDIRLDKSGIFEASLYNQGSASGSTNSNGLREEILRIHSGLIQKITENAVSENPRLSSVMHGLSNFTRIVDLSKN